MLLYRATFLQAAACPNSHTAMLVKLAHRIDVVGSWGFETTYADGTCCLLCLFAIVLSDIRYNTDGVGSFCTEPEDKVGKYIYSQCQTCMKRHVKD